MIFPHFHKFELVLVGTSTSRDFKGFTLALSQCSHKGCKKRDWSATGQIDDIDRFNSCMLEKEKTLNLKNVSHAEYDPDEITKVPYPCDGCCSCVNCVVCWRIHGGPKK